MEVHDGGGPSVIADAGTMTIESVTCNDGAARDELGACAAGCEAAQLCPSEGAPCCETCLCERTVRVEAGEYWRGSPETEEYRDLDEPRHRVSITRALAVDRTEVTQAEWRRLMGTEPSSYAGCDACPVESVSYYEALQYANARSAEEGRPACYVLEDCYGPATPGCPDDVRNWRRCDGTICARAELLGLDCEGWRLPTEAECEYFARAGSEGPFPSSDDDAMASTYGWCSDSGGHPHPVGLKPANAFGLLDVLGNVYEWTWDGYAPYETASADVLVDPIAPLTVNGAVIRSGAFLWGDGYCRSANRGSRPAQSRENIVGLRLVRTLR